MGTNQIQPSTSSPRQFSLETPDRSRVPVWDATRSRLIQRVVSPAPLDAWQTIYASDQNAMPTQSPSWGAAVASSGKYKDASRLYEFADGSRALVPLFSAWFAPNSLSPLWSPPTAWGFGGIISTRPVTSEHVRAVMHDLKSGPNIVVHLRPNPLQAEVWREATSPGWSTVPRSAHVLDLTDGFDEVWTSRYRSETRNKIRRAERFGLEIEAGVSERLVSDFYGLLIKSFQRWGRRQHEPMWLSQWRGKRRDPESKFRAIGKFDGEHVKFWVARVQGQPIAAILVLMDRQAHYTRGAMDEQAIGQTYANYLLHSRAIEDACRAGCGFYHMGETGGSASLAQFKTRFGAVSVPYAEYRYEKLPLSKADHGISKLVKRMVGFRDIHS